MAKKDLLTIGYEVTGKMFRNSLEGRLLKLGITNNLSKRARDVLLDKFKAPEDYKRFAQYLSGGTVGNKPITELPADVKQEVIDAHKANRYPERNRSPLLTKDGFYGKKGDPNPKYNPDSNLLSLYKSSNEARRSLGHVQYIPDGKGGYTMTDTWDVDEWKFNQGANSGLPLRGYHTDLLEGGQLAARAYDLSRWLGINKPFKYNVKFSRDDLKIKK
tara:strand:- start:186 stop:836 length:651 start_codon:yes stop_codon:yes gene_type:complete